MFKNLRYFILFIFPLIFLSNCSMHKEPISSQNNERFGIMTHFSQGPSDGWPVSLIDELNSSSLRYVRDEIPWAGIEEKKGSFSFPAEYDAYMAKLNEYKISPFIVLAFANKNYDQGQTPHSEEGLAGYARYCREVLAHYGTQIHDVEIWNEYNGGFCTGPAAQAKEENYLKMLKAAYTSIKANRPDVTVVGGATAGVPLIYWEKLLASGAAKYMDALSIHPYRFEMPPEGIQNEVTSLRELIKKYNGGKEKPIWVSEIGWGASNNEVTGSMSITEEIQAKFLTRVYALLLSAKVERVYWYLLQDYQEFEMGLLKRDSAPRKSYLALKTLQKELQGMRFIKREASEDDLYSMLFADNSGKEVRILWTISPTSKHYNLKTSDGVVDMLGNSVDLSNGIDLTDEPLYIRGKVSGLSFAGNFNTSLITDSELDFSKTQGKNGWFYGFYEEGAFKLMSEFNTTDKVQWNDQYPFLLIAPAEQHPSLQEDKPMSAVRRWVSSFDGKIEIRAEFYHGSEGDGVGVSVCMDGQKFFRELIGKQNNLSKTFITTQVVKKGTTLDFVVDPGDNSNMECDGTMMNIRIHRAQ